MVQFSKLRLQGFKSFVDQTELEIGDGLTGIVGPNGCGKSNLVEALRWVMGETSAKKMRGGGMDDVIFAGTSNRPARNNANVALVLDNQDRSAPKPFQDVDELEITRKIERESGSVYRINGKAVRARDVQLLFADTVSGANSSALISQGRVTAIINAKPSERRRILEESAGVAGLYARRHEAELRLKAAESNLVRLDDMMGEMENRLSALKRQARQATRYKNISTHIKDLEALTAWLEWHQNSEKLKTLNTDFENAEENVRETMSVVTKLTSEEALKSKDLPELRKAEAEAAARLQAQTMEAQKLGEEKRRVEVDIERLKETIQQAQDDLAHEKSEIPELKELLDKRLNEKQDLDAQKEGKDLTQEKQNLREALSKELNDIEVMLRELQAEQASYETSINTLEAAKNKAQRELGEWQEEVTRLESQLDSHNNENPDASRLQALEGDLGDLETNLEKLKAKRPEFHTSIEVSEEKLHGLKEKEAKSQNSISKIDSEISTLENILKSISEGDFTPVLESIKADSGFETALAKALGDGVMAALDANAQSYWMEVKPSAQQSLPKGVVPISDKVKAPKALNIALSQIGIVESDDAAKEKLSELKPGQILVTHDGAVYRWDGYCVKAETQSAAAIQLEQKNRIETLLKELKSAQSKYEVVKKGVLNEKSALESVKNELKELSVQINDTEQEIYSKRQTVQNIKESLQQWEIDKSRYEDRLSQSKEMLLKVEVEYKEAEETLKDANSKDQSDLTKRISKFEEQINEQKQKLSEAVQDYERYTYEKSQFEERVDFVTQEIERLQTRLSKTDDRLAVFVRRKEEAETNLETLTSKPAELEAAYETLQEGLDELTAERDKTADALVEKETALTEIQKTLKEAEEGLVQARESRAGVQSSLAAVQAQEEMARAHIKNDMNMTPEALTRHLEITEETELPSLEEAHQKREKLLRERDNMGAVNLRAQEEVAEIEKECGVMVTERDDLIEAIEQLRQGISKLNREARQRLKEAFESVNTYFKDLFTRLYGGGQAYLELVESEDVLDAGLEIYAQPPGKKLQSLSLLSGGEQTLASIALIFAMFLTNPSPICVLDEIDAPLDDANVDRVCGLLEEIASKAETRFLIVTHHRMTMARMDRLYGVTMAEKGISQLVSVDMAVQGELLVEAAE